MTIAGYKGFDEQLQCRGFQYAVGETYETDQQPLRCTENGFHLCEHPFDVWAYYPPALSRFCAVTGEGEVDRGEEDSKVAVSKLHVGMEIGLTGLINAGVKLVLERVKWETQKESNTGHSSAATNTGYRSAATNTGYWSAATNTGDQSAATNTGDRSAATNTGYRSAATNTGDRSAATNTGYRSAASVKGKESVAVAMGYQSRAKGGLGCWLVLAEWDATGEHILDVQSVRVDGDRIQANTWYRLEQGQFVVDWGEA